jgi:GxxExxY protein
MQDVDQVTGRIIDAALQLHRHLGPGLMESVYSVLLARSLQQRGLVVEREKTISFEYDGIRFENGLRLDLLVEDRVIVELKSVDKLAPIHAKQVLTYLRVLDLRVGLLMNYGAPTVREGLKRVVNDHIPLPNSPLRVHQPRS